MTGKQREEIQKYIQQEIEDLKLFLQKDIKKEVAEALEQDRQELARVVAEVEETLNDLHI